MLFSVLNKIPVIIHYLIHVEFVAISNKLSHFMFT